MRVSYFQSNLFLPVLRLEGGFQFSPSILIEILGQGLGKKKGITQQQLNKFSKLCNQSTDAVLESDDLANCNKLGAWKNRAAHLLNDVEIMRNVCKNQPKNPATGY